MHKNGDFEVEENAKDYIAMHVYPNNEKGSKILAASGSLIRSTYSPEQSVMLYLEIKATEYFNLNKVLNLVLDQLDRKQDLFYQVRVFSSHPFEMNRIGKQFKMMEKVAITDCVGGGTPSSHLFYKNPQFLLYVDKSKFTNIAMAHQQFDVLLTFTAKNPEQAVKIFLCHASIGN